MSFITENKTYQDLKSFLTETNVTGTALGFLIASATLDLARTTVSEGMYPFITALRTGALPRFDLDEIFQSLITFFLSMLVAFASIKIFNLQERKLPLVMTVGAGSIA
jgi:large-conductance mechanosensitive channel